MRIASPCSRPLVENLEDRRYAASAERVTTVVNDPARSAIVVQFSASEAPDISKLQRALVFVNKANNLTVQGGIGDDSVRVRVIKGGLEIRTITRQTFRYFARNKRTALEATASFDSVYRFSSKEFAALEVNGGQGSDFLRFVGNLAYNPPITSIEAEASRDYPKTALGQTPSDPAARDGEFWHDKVEDEKAKADTSTAETAFFGDSYVESFLTTGRGSWNGYFRNASNFGIGGDSTRNALARIRNGLFDTYKPRTLVVSIGTNDFNNPLTGGSDTQVYQGVIKVMTELRKRLPDARIVLLSLLPRNGAGLNERIEKLNGLFATTPNAPFAFLHLYDRFSRNAYTVLSDQNGDKYEIALVGTDSHYTRRGYSVLAYHIKELLNGLPATA